MRAEEELSFGAKSVAYLCHRCQHFSSLFFLHVRSVSGFDFIQVFGTESFKLTCLALVEFECKIFDALDYLASCAHASCSSPELFLFFALFLFFLSILPFSSCWRFAMRSAAISMPLFFQHGEVHRTIFRVIIMKCACLCERHGCNSVCICMQVVCCCYYYVL